MYFAGCNIIEANHSFHRGKNWREMEFLFRYCQLATYSYKEGTDTVTPKTIYIPFWLFGRITLSFQSVLQAPWVDLANLENVSHKSLFSKNYTQFKRINAVGFNMQITFGTFTIIVEFDCERKSQVRPPIFTKTISKKDQKK